MRIISVMVAVLAAQAVWGQPVFIDRMTRTRPDFDYLYERVSGSDFVIKGKVLLDSSKLVLKRIPIAELAKLDFEDKVGGSLFAIEPYETVCRQSDFAAASPQMTLPAGLVYIFAPWRESEAAPSVSDYDLNRRFHNESATMVRGRVYLLFLRKAPHQEDLTSKNVLDPSVTYYRTFEGDLGAVELPDAANPEKPHSFVTPLVSAVTAMCEAVRAPDVPTKIRNLNAARDHSTDPAWHQSVDAAIWSFRKQQSQPPSPPE